MDLHAEDYGASHCLSKSEFRRVSNLIQLHREGVVGVSNPGEAVVGIMSLLDEVRVKMEGTRLAERPWRPASPESAEALAELATEALARCDDASEALIVVTVAAMMAAQGEQARRAPM